MSRQHLALDLHEDLPHWVEGFLAQRGRTFQELERGDLWRAASFPFASLEELVTYLFTSDPVRFVECTFLERDLPGNPPWRLWPYQAVSMRYRGNVIHEDAAEVGKTREIAGLVVWLALTHVGDQLVAGALDGHVDAIWKMVSWQLHKNPWLEAQFDWDASKKKPYVELVAKNGNVVYFRPAGHDGTALRSAHCRLAIYMDEAVKVKARESWGNFFSRAKPGAEIRIYSTPDGDRGCRFFELAQAAPPVEPDGSNLEAVSASAADIGIEGLKGSRFIRFRWPKSLMPPKYYNPVRLAGWEEQYGPPDSSEYQHNVLGNWGDPECSVFPWSQLARCLHYIPEYTCLRILWDDASLRATLSAYKLEAGYVSAGPAGDEDLGAGAVTSPTRSLVSRRDVPGRELAEVDDVEVLLREFLRPLPGILLVGIDPGSSDDPAEILVWQVLTPVYRCVARIQLRRFQTPAMRRVHYALQRIYAPQCGWGLDATGAGSPLQHELQSGLEDPLAASAFALHLTGFVLNAATVDRNYQTGEAAVDPDTGKERRVLYLEQGVRLVKEDLNRCHLELPYDPDFGLQFPGYTERKGASGRSTYGHNKNDHLVAATLVARLRHFHLTHGSLAPVPVTFASLGRRRDLDHDGDPSRRRGSRGRGAGHPLDDLVGGDVGRPFAAGGESAATALRDW